MWARSPVPDDRLDKIAKIAGSKATIPTRLTFVDIAGLVRGASKGEGLGNQFLANIREVDAIAYVLRCFEDDDVTHVEGRVDLSPTPRRSDRAHACGSREPGAAQASLGKKAKGQDKEAKAALALVEPL